MKVIFETLSLAMFQATYKQFEHFCTDDDIEARGPVMTSAWKWLLLRMKFKCNFYDDELVTQVMMILIQYLCDTL